MPAEPDLFRLRDESRLTSPSGNPRARLLFVGEAPGETDDRQE